MAITRWIVLAVAGLIALGPAPAGAQPAAMWGNHAYFSLNGMYQTDNLTFRDTAALDVYREAGSLTATHEIRGGPAFDVTVGGPLKGYLGMGYGFSYVRRHEVATVDASVPHPFYFDRNRTMSGLSPDLTHEERVIHVNLMALLPFADRLQAVVFGGPTYFWMKQEIVTNLTFAESYPYDEATFEQATTRAQKGSGWGYNAGADLTFYFSDFVGIGGLVRYTRASVKLPSAGGGKTAIDAGGLQAGAGLRCRF